MKRVIVRSVYDAFEYVMEHFYCFGEQDMAARTDSYAVISIQDTYTGGFGIRFEKNRFCKDVITLYFDDVVKETDGAVAFDDEMADKIIGFIQKNRFAADTLLVHCYAGQSRSRAVGAFAVKMLGGDNSRYFKNGTMNMYIYDVLETAWIRGKLGGEF